MRLDSRPQTSPSEPSVPGALACHRDQSASASGRHSRRPVPTKKKSIKEPPEIAGRGTARLVGQVEKRHTPIAVKYDEAVTCRGYGIAKLRAKFQLRRSDFSDWGIVRASVQRNVRPQRPTASPPAREPSICDRASVRMGQTDLTSGGLVTLRCQVAIGVSMVSGSSRRTQESCCAQPSFASNSAGMCGTGSDFCQQGNSSTRAIQVRMPG